MTRQQRTSIRIVAGDLRGRRLTVIVSDELRPTPQMVREAFFSILGDAIPDRPFYDVFAGTGVIGLEALSRGARSAVFLERDFRLAAGIDGYLKEFDVADRGHVVRADVYRWAERWQPHAETPINVFLSPPFADLTHRLDDFLKLVAELQETLSHVKTLHGLLPMCAFCHKIRNAEGKWERLEAYISSHTDADFTHGFCPECNEKHYGVKMPANSSPAK